MKIIFTSLMFCIAINFAVGQEFQIETGSDNTFAMSASFDGTNYLIPIKGDNQSSENATAQFVSASGNLVGSRILIGSDVASHGIISTFDGTNYLLVWIANNGNVIGQFLSPNGSLIGSQIIIATNASTGRTSTTLTFNSGSYLVCYLKDVDIVNHRGYLWGQRINTNGSLIGSEFQITNNYAREVSIAFDGTNYLVAYVHNTENQSKDLYARFVSTSGTLVGNEITVASGSFQRDNPTSLAFDGSKYLLAYHEQNPNDHQWFLYGRFIDTNGNLQNSITICDSSFHPMIPMLSFGNNNYLATWFQETDGNLMGQWYNVSGVSIGSPFIVMNTLNNKFPIGATIFENNTFLAIVTRLDNNFSNGDVYGKFINSQTSISEIQSLDKILIYPNPAYDFVFINIDNINSDELILNFYNAIGKLVKSESLIQNQQQINVGDLSNGIYMLEIQSKKWTEKQKLLIQR